MRFTVLLLIGFVFLDPSDTKAQLDDKLDFNQSINVETAPKKSKSPKGAMIRSAIFPGWGQVYNNKYLKALVYLGGESYFIYRYSVINKDVNKLKNDNATEDKIKNKEHLRNGWAWLFSAGYLLALGDAYVDAHLHGLYSDNKLSVGFKPIDRSRSLQMQINLTF